MTKDELIKYYKEELNRKKIAFKEQRKEYKAQFGHDIGAIVINAHEEECFILRETIMALKGYKK